MFVREFAIQFSLEEHDNDARFYPSVTMAAGSLRCLEELLFRTIAASRVCICHSTLSQHY